MNEIVRPITDDGQVGFDEFDQLMCWTPTGDSKGKVGRIISDLRQTTCVICDHGWEATALSLVNQFYWQLTNSHVHETCLIRHAGLNERSEFQRVMLGARTRNVHVRYKTSDIENRYWPKGDPYSAKPWYQFDLIDFPVRFIIGSRKRVGVVQVEPIEHSPTVLYWWSDAQDAFADEDVTKEFGPDRVMLHAWGQEKLREYVKKLAWFAEGSP